MLAHVDGGRLARISRVLLKREAEYGDPFSVQRVEEALGDAVGETLLLVVVDAQHLEPVFGTLAQVERFANVNQVVDVLLEAAAAEADARLQKLAADASVGADGLGYLLDVCAAGFADGRNRVDARDSLSQKSVGRQFRQL